METRLSYWGVGMQGDRGTVGGAAARLEGILSLAGNCLVVTTASGSKAQPVFPAGRARWDSSARVLEYGGKTYRLGESITLGGGGVGSPAGFAQEAGVQIADCEIRDLFVVAG